MVHKAIILHTFNWDFGKGLGICFDVPGPKSFLSMGSLRSAFCIGSRHKGFLMEVGFRI